MDVSELDERMSDLKTELEGYKGEEHDESNKKKALDALKRMENWNLFSDTIEVSLSHTHSGMLYSLVIKDAMVL